jgi:hypothetical protein
MGRRSERRAQRRQAGKKKAARRFRIEPRVFFTSVGEAAEVVGGNRLRQVVSLTEDHAIHVPAVEP